MQAKTVLTESPRQSAPGRRGEVWLVRFGVGQPGEPGKNRPAAIISVDALVAGVPEDLFVVVPISASREPSGLRPIVTTAEGVDRPSVAVCRAVRSVSATRMLERLGTLSAATLRAVEDALAQILGLP